MSEKDANPNPLGSLDEWEDDLLERYPDPHGSETDKGNDGSPATEKTKDEYRNYDDLIAKYLPEKLAW